jgi:hypothetical protein
MAEPTSSTAGIAIAAGTITLSGSILGVHYDALLAGFFGGLVSLSYLPSMSIPRIAGTVIASALTAGFFAPVLSVAAVNYFSWLAGTGDNARIAAAAAIGLCAQVAIPAIFNLIRKKGGLA